MHPPSLSRRVAPPQPVSLLPNATSATQPALLPPIPDNASQQGPILSHTTSSMHRPLQRLPARSPQPAPPLVLYTTTSATHFSSQSSRATSLPDLPLEFVLIILELLESAATSESSWRSAQRGLSACSQTCKQWAERFQPLLFRHFTLRSEADLNRLHRLSASPESRLVEYIEHLEVLEMAGSERWAQHFTRLLWCRLPRLSTIVQRTVMNFHTGFSHRSSPLPELTPVTPALFASGFRTVRRLHLKNYKYQNFSILTRYLGAFPGLEEVHFSVVTWADGSPSLSGRSSLKICPSLSLATAYSCTDNLAILSLFAFSPRGPKALFGLSRAEIPAIVAFGNVLLHGSEDKDPSGYTTCIRRSEGRLPQLL